MKSTQTLVAKHDAVLLALDILETIQINPAAGASPAMEHLEQLIDFFRGFVDKCHHGKEEEVLFPALEKLGVPRDGGPIGVMLYEHEVGRRYIQEMAEALASLRSGNATAAETIRKSALEYEEMLRNHIAKENNVLYPIADRLMNSGDDAQMSEAFETIERERVGEGRHEAYHRMLHQLKETYKL